LRLHWKRQACAKLLYEFLNIKIPVIHHYASDKVSAVSWELIFDFGNIDYFVNK